MIFLFWVFFFTTLFHAFFQLVEHNQINLYLESISKSLQTLYSILYTDAAVYARFITSCTIFTNRLRQHNFRCAFLFHNTLFVIYITAIYFFTYICYSVVVVREEKNTNICISLFMNLSLNLIITPKTACSA